MNLRDAVGNTALHTAVFENVENVYCKTLVVFGVDLEARNHSNKTAYQVRGFKLTKFASIMDPARILCATGQ